MNAIKDFFKYFLQAIADSRNEEPVQTAKYFAWHALALLAMNVVALMIGLAYSMNFYGWVCFYQLALISPTVIGLGINLTFRTQGAYLKSLNNDNALKNTDINTVYYMIGFIIAFVNQQVERLFSQK